MFARLFIAYCAAALLASGAAVDFSKIPGRSKNAGKIAPPSSNPSRSEIEWIYIDNGEIRLGLKLSAAGAVGYFSSSNSRENLLSSDDHARLVQTVLFGNKDGSIWNKQPWQWNAVQAGDVNGKPARTIDFKIKKTSAYVKSIPRHWVTGADLTEVVLEQWISLTGKIAHVHFKITCSGETHHGECEQQTPAFSVNPHYDILVTYDGAAPWSDAPLSRFAPGRSLEKKKISECWAAYVNEKDFGVGAYVPGASLLACQRPVSANGTRYSFFAPLTQLAILPGSVYEFDCFITLGRSSEIRNAFEYLARPAQSKPRPN